MISRAIMANVQDFDIVSSEFGLQSLNYVHFQTFYSKQLVK